jgi:ribonuclease E
MQSGDKRKQSDPSSESSSDDTWTPDVEHAEPVEEVSNTIQTRSRGPAQKPDQDVADTAMNAVDGVVDNESDLSSDTEEDEDDDDDEESDEDADDESSEEDDYSDDDSFVTSNEDADLEEREDVVRDYSDVFEDACEDISDAVVCQEEDLSIGGPLAEM